MVITSVSQIERAFAEWAITTLNGIFTMWAGQNVEIPENYVLFEHFTKRAITKPIETTIQNTTSDTYDTYFDTPLEVVIRVNVFGSDSYSKAWKLESSLGKPLWRKFFNDKGIGIEKVAEVERIIEPEDSEYLEQAQCQVYFNCTWRDSESVDTGQIAEVSGDVFTDPTHDEADINFEVNGQYLWPI